MNDFNTTCAQLFRAGWVPHFRMIEGGKWHCCLECGVDVMPDYLPRPTAIGDTANTALILAVRNRDKMLAERKKKRQTVGV
jgi:hypothetical protein